MPIRTAHTAFLESPHRVGFEKISETRDFDAACEYALLCLVEELPSADIDPNKNWALFSQVTGAKRLLQILRTLHLKEEPVKRMQLPQLKPPQ